MYFEDTTDANGVFQAQQSGRLFLIESITGASSVKVDIRRGRNAVYLGIKRPRGFRLFVPDGFDLIRLEAAPGTIIGYSLAQEDVQLSIADGMEVTVPTGVLISNTPANRVPVDVGGAAINVTATNVGLISPDGFTAAADVAINAGAQSLVIAAAAGISRRYVIIKNLSANAAAFRIGPNTAAAAVGHEVGPGEAITLETTAAIYAYNLGAAPQSLSVVTITKV